MYIITLRGCIRDESLCILFSGLAVDISAPLGNSRPTAAIKYYFY